MAIERESFLEILKDSYSAYYNLNPNEGLTELPLVFRADFFSQGQQYFLMKEAKIWTNETCEYLYLFSAPQFTAEQVSKCLDFVLEDGQPRVRPHKEHQYTNFIAIFVADMLSEDVKQEIKNRRFSKSYNHSLWGFSMLKSAGVELATEKICTNREGHDLAGFYKKLFASRKEGGKASRNKFLFF